ncbi:hypothetical protein ANHS_1863 [Ligilactobacillus ruminis ATCC 25644]|nr:hypothetical protein ANHS_1863 [Ligilactobacillus ruminis ATCC 25644]
MIDMGNNRNVANIITCFQSFFFLSNGMLKKMSSGNHLFRFHFIQEKRKPFS